MLADRGELAACENIYEAGVTDSIAKPYSCDELKLRMNLLVRESRFRESLKKIYSQAKHYATSDALTGLYSRGFLLEHVSTMVTDANRTSQSFSLAKLSIGNIEAINSELGYAAGDRIIRQVGEVIGLLIRGEDLAARYSGAKFIVALPDTPVEQAKYAIQRINGVIAHTEFVVDGHYAPVKVTLNTTLSGFQQGDTAESLVERTHKVDLRVAA
jgi:two-component system cell cycle response regulator